MAQHKSWTMSAIVVGTYLCAVCFAGGPAADGRVQSVRPGVAVRPPATRPAVARPALASVEDLAVD